MAMSPLPRYSPHTPPLTVKQSPREANYTTLLSHDLRLNLVKESRRILKKDLIKPSLFLRWADSLDLYLRCHGALRRMGI